MIKPHLQDEAFLSDVRDVQRRAGVLDIWWLGQSGFLIHHRELWVLIDPYLSDSLTKKYATTDKPHVRMAQRVVDPGALASRLGFVNVLTSSHGHTDHLDPETLRPILSNGRVANVVVPRSVVQVAFERTGATSLAPSPKFIGMDDGDTIDLGIRITAIPAAHETVERDERGNCKYLGYVFEFGPFLVSTRSGSTFPQNKKEWTVYHSGDTVLYDGMVERLRPFNIDVALLPINGRAPERRVAGNLWGREAAHLAKDIGAKLVIPCHYDMFEFNTADPADEFIPACEELDQPYRVLQLGQRFSSDEIPGRT